MHLGQPGATHEHIIEWRAMLLTCWAKASIWSNACLARLEQSFSMEGEIGGSFRLITSGSELPRS